MSLAEYSGELLQSLMPYKIYDALPWEEEMALMLDRWQQFVNCAQTDTTYVFNCIFLQNPMCETMMRFGFDEAVSKQYIEAIANIIRPMNPVVIYLKNDTIAASVVNASSKRPGWLEAVIDYHIHGAYGVSIGADGFEGYIRCLQERQMRELRILDQLPVKRIVLDNPQMDWKGAKEQLKSMIVNM